MFTTQSDLITAAYSVLSFSLLALVACSGKVAQHSSPPVAKKIPVESTIHGDTRVDNYMWLQKKENSEVLDYLKAENHYTHAMMEETESLQETLYAEMVSRVKESDLDVPYRKGDYFYYTRVEKGKEYPVHCRKRGSLDADEEILLDLNTLAEGESYLDVAVFEVTDDGTHLAYSIDTKGFREYTLHIKNLQTGELLPDRIEHVESAVWDAEGKTIFYTKEDTTKRPDTLHAHTPGKLEDRLVFDEPDDRFRLYVSKTLDGKYILITSYASDTTEVRVIPSSDPDTTPRVTVEREQGHEYSLFHNQGKFYLLTNRDAQNFKVVTAPAANPKPGNWRELIPHRDHILIESMELFRDFAVFREKENALQQIRIINLSTGEEHIVEFTEAAYAIYPGDNEEFTAENYRFSYESMVTPETVYDYNMKTQKRSLLKEKEIPAYNKSDYTMERIWAPAQDGKKVPVTLLYRKRFKRDGSHPLLLSGYGSYGYARPAVFRQTYFSLVDRGFTFALAHIRGGDEMGRAWYEDGKLMNKKNTFTDFIACSEYLIAEDYTTKEGLVITGGSAGGLLLGAVTNMRPDLFGAVVSYVPFVDVINTMLNPDIPLTTEEYLEWGNPNEEEAYRYIKSYCPYSNIEEKNYPPIFIRTSLHDSQVMYWEPAKYVAKLRDMKTDSNELLLIINMEAGHGGSSGRYSVLKEDAFDFAWILSQFNIDK